MKKISYLLIIFLLFFSPAQIFAEQGLKPLEKKCGISVSDGFWGVFSRNQLLNNSLSHFQKNLYFATRHGAVRSYSPQDGKLRRIAKRKSGITSAIYADKEVICGGEENGQVFCLNQQSGKEIWSYKVNGEVRARPYAKEGIIYFVTSSSYLYALDKLTGKWLWQYRREFPNSITLLGTASISGKGKQLFAGFADGYVVSLNRFDGSLLWQQKLADGKKLIDVDSTAVVYKDSILVGSIEGRFQRLSQQGVVLWLTDLALARAVALDNNSDTAYLAGQDGKLTALSLKDGKILYQTKLEDGVLLEPTISGRYLLTAAAGGKVYLSELATGKLIWTYQTDSSLNAGAIALNSKSEEFFLLSQRGELFCLAAKK